MRKLIFGLSCAVLALGAMTPAHATAFFNDFESGNYGGTGYVILQDYEGWDATAGDGIEVQFGGVAGAAHSGKHLIELDSNNNSAMSRAIDAGSYTLTFWYSDRPSVAALSNGIDVLLNGTSILPIIGGLGGAGTSWSFKTVSFDAGPGSNVLTFAALGTSDSLGGYIDDVTLSPVPEAATWAMMLVGFGVVGHAMRRRRTSVSFA